MVARIDNELLSPGLLTPRPDLSDSDDVLLAVETARALETQGELREAARWLRRAADEAEKQGNDERVLVLALAAAEMSNIIGSSPPPQSEVPTIPPASAEVLEAGDAQYPPTTPPPEAFVPTLPPPASAAATLPPPLPAAAATLPQPLPAPATISSPPDMPFAERSMRIGAIRVAILEASIRGAKSFFVERLEKGQLPPAGSTEAMLVFTGEAESDAEQNVDLLAASDSIMP
jgi:hypothetical protein